MKHRCIQEFNGGAGFIVNHTSRCSSLNGSGICNEPVTAHARIDYFCGNMCEAHEKKFTARHKDAQVLEPILLE